MFMETYSTKFVNCMLDKYSSGVISSLAIPSFSTIVSATVTSINSEYLNICITYKYDSNNYDEDTIIQIKCIDPTNNQITLEDGYNFLTDYIYGDLLYKSIALVLYKRLPGTIEMRDNKIETISK